MAQTRDWQGMQAMSARLLKERTGADVDTWNQRIKAEGFADEQELRAWLTARGVTGYAQSLLVMERFGYPDYLVASAAELIDRQYAGRPELRAIYDKVLASTRDFGAVAVQARKAFVSLVTPRRTFARVVPRARRVELALRLDGQRPTGRLESSTIHETMRLQIGLESRADVDEEVTRWLRRAYQENS